MQTTTVWRPRGLPDLNFDILLQIISDLKPRDVARLTRTCHALRRALSAELPRGGVTLKGQHLTSFLEFANDKHGKDRLSYFRELVLPGSTYDTSAMEDSGQTMSLRDAKRGLLTILHSARNLSSLSILDLDAFSFPTKDLKTMLDSLPRLRELEMSGIQKKHEGVLINVLPRLQTLGLDFLDGCDASVFLKSHQTDSLEDVALYNAMFKDTSISFPTVHTLRARPTNFPSDVDALVRIFPNVKDVIFDFPHECGSLDAEYRKRLPRGFVRYFGIGSIDPAGASVQELRGRLLTRPQRKADAWPHIQSLLAVGITGGNLIWLGLTCEVPRLEVSSWRMKKTQLACVLNELHVRCLVLHPGTHHALSNNQPAYGWELLAALRSAPTVTQLAVVLCRPSVGYFSAATWLDTFSVHLGKSSVSYLMVRLVFDHRLNKKLSDLIWAWRKAIARKSTLLRIFLCQVGDRVPQGWVKEERGWKEMTEDETQKFVASESICPAITEPCEQCQSERRRRNRGL